MTGNITTKTGVYETICSYTPPDGKAFTYNVTVVATDGAHMGVWRRQYVGRRDGSAYECIKHLAVKSLVSVNDFAATIMDISVTTAHGAPHERIDFLVRGIDGVEIRWACNVEILETL